MAGDWYPKRVWFTKQREVVLVATLTGRSPQEVAGFLDDLWSFATENTADGFIPGVDLRGLLSAAGADETLWRAVEHAGWLCFRDGGIEIPNWQNWLSQSTKKRLKEQIRKRLGRAAGGGQTSKKNGRTSKKSAPEKREEKREEKNTPPKSPPTGGGSSGKPAPEVPLPPELDTPEFRAAWAEYVAYRRESRLRPLAPVTVKSRWKEMAAWGVGAAVKALRNSIANGWQGIFHPSERAGDGGKRVGPAHRVGTPAGKYDGVGIRVGGSGGAEAAGGTGLPFPAEQGPQPGGG